MNCKISIKKKNNVKLNRRWQIIKKIEPGKWNTFIKKREKRIMMLLCRKEYKTFDRFDIPIQVK